jgi:tetratricopeptide (TPR) repeat protein
MQKPNLIPVSRFHVKKHSLTRLVCVASLVVLVTSLAERLCAQTTNTAASATDIVITEIEGKVEVLPLGAQTWKSVETTNVLHVGDRVRTRENSRITLRFSDLSIARFGSLNEFVIEPPAAPNKQPGFSLSRGLLYFFHRDKPAALRINTRTAAAAINGTEFNLEAEDSGRTVLTVIDGDMELSNAEGRITLKSGEQGTAEPGKPPTKTAVINTINVIQWALYYPAVLDLDELSLSQEEQQLLERSLTAYRSGDLLRALADYPAERTPVSSTEKVYLGALLLAVGQVGQSGKIFDSLSQDGAAGATNDTNIILAGAVRQLIAAVKLQPWQRSSAPELATEWLAESYYRQSLADLSEALRAARKAVEKSPNFGFGWARVAELEFSFGRISEAVEALEKSLQLAPRNPEALALKGFLLGAQNKIREAINYFEQAMAIDSALGNAWLGRGLCRIRQGKADAGRKDLLVAAALEPQRALLRSYLGKAYTDAGDKERATKELARARELDPKDPTAWLYLALLEQQNNQINDAVRDLEKSQELNKNRRVYRSQLLLDQDRAVGSANLANVYRDAGMIDVSMREAGRSVSADYANYSAHLFLANSYDQLRDPNGINLRYETPAESEYLIANLLAPVGAGTLSQSISQQEYSKLFERDRLGVVSSTEYLSRGAWTQNGAQFGTFGNSSYAFEAFYRTDPGQRPNNDFEGRELHLLLKQQLTAQDSIYLQAVHSEISGGDLFQYYDQSSANSEVRTEEKQEPILSLGYHREWSPGVHTIFYASRLDDTFSLTNTAGPILSDTIIGGELLAVRGNITMHEDLRIAQEIYSTELQQIWQQSAHNTIVGARVQYGHYQTKNLQNFPSAGAAAFDEPAASQDLTTLFKRMAFYGYHHWQVDDALQVIGGLSYDRVTFPENFRTAPISDREETVDRVSPKAGLILTPTTNSTIRFAYTRSLSGASVEQDFQLEPAQIAGFVQSYRSIIPDSVSGANAGARFETIGVSLEQKLHARTYLGASGEVLNSQVRRTVGAFELRPEEFEFAIPSGLREHLDFRERSLLFTINQLIGDELSVGARYRLTNAKLKDDFVDVPDNILLFNFQPRQHVESVLHQLGLFTLYNHPSGFFARFDAQWYSQSNQGYTPDIPGDDFWQFNAFAGYRFPRRKAELMVGLLNITDQDYRLNPLTIYNELPRERTITVRLRLNF